MTTKESLHADPYEKKWIILSIVLLLVFIVAITVAGLALGIQLPSSEQRVDPNTVDAPGQPWSPELRGLRELAPGKYEAYILAQIWAFQPRDITVPVGSTVTFFVTSKDVQHGFKIQDTNVNVQVVPGHVSQLTVNFDKPGQYNYICTEYCGAGHAAMFGSVIVEP